MTPCQDPECQEYATFALRHGAAVYQFCTKHVWGRAHRWVTKLPKGDGVVVTSIDKETGQAVPPGGVVRGVRPDYGAGIVVVPGALHREITEGSQNPTTETVTPGEVPAMRKPTKSKRK